MKRLLVSFSGRKGSGNCIGVSKYISEGSPKYEDSIIDITDFEIESCFNCDYECFDTGCPKDDDVYELYEEMMRYDSVIFVLPVYSGTPCSKFFAFRERSQGIFDEGSYKRYQRVKKNYIVIGNEEAGGKDAVKIVKMVEGSSGEILLLQSHRYGERSLSGDLIEREEVRKDIDRFLDRIE